MRKVVLASGKAAGRICNAPMGTMGFSELGTRANVPRPVIGMPKEREKGLTGLLRNSGLNIGATGKTICVPKQIVREHKKISQLRHGIGLGTICSTSEPSRAFSRLITW